MDTFLTELFEFEYCGECGGDADDHVLCEGPFGLPFAMCKVGIIVEGFAFRHGQFVAVN